MQRMMRACAIAITLALGGVISPPGLAVTEAAWAQAQAERLWMHPQWLRLVHYRPGAVPGSWYSQADDPDFFLSAAGAHDPRAELAATLSAFAADASLGDAHAQCRFVARLAWLRERLDLGELPQPDCAAYRAFRDTVRAQRVVLVFPSYYLNSPSSMFGHTLLRLDPDASAEVGTEYLSFAVNFGALVDPADTGVLYAVKGLTGGYRGQFAVDFYFKKIQEYTRSENRDIWEYPLDLNAVEIERLIAHLWELRDIDFAYYFFDENCAYRVLELLEVARPGIDLTSAFALTAIPIDTVRAAQQAGLVRGRQFRPAQGTVLRQRLAQIPPVLHAQVLELAASPERLDDADMQALEPSMRARVIDAAYRYLRFRQTGVARDPAIAQQSFRLLQAMRAEASALPVAAPVVPDVPPDLSHGSRRLAVGVWREEELQYLSLGLRMALHGLEENRDGFPWGAQLNMGHLELRVDEYGRLDLNRLDLVDIASLTPRDRFFRPLSWAVATGIERQWTDGREHRVAQINGGIGFTRAAGFDGLIYGLATARLEYNHGFADPLQPAGGLRGGSLMALGPLTLNGELGAEAFANGALRLRAELRGNWPLSRHQALHLELRWRDQRPDDTFAVGLRYLLYR